MYQKFSILTYFCMKFFIFRHGLLTARLAKTTAHRVLFLVSMDSQRSKKFDGSHFWALECLLTASGWLESIRGHNGPALTVNVCHNLHNAQPICALEIFPSLITQEKQKQL